MSAARQLISEAALHGATFRFDGDRVRLIPRPGEPIPADLVGRAKAMRPALIAELRRERLSTVPVGHLRDSGTFRTAGTPDRCSVAIPESVEKRVEELSSYHCPEGFPPERWGRLRAGALRFAAEWGDKALSLGWTDDELFGVVEPFANVSRQGAAWFVGDSTVTAVTADAITLRRTSGSVTRIYRDSAPVRQEPEAAESRP
jgi:hypothetical protein